MDATDTPVKPVGLHPSGNLVVAGLDKEMINRGGEKISAEQVENLIYRLPGVARVAAVAVPDSALGERVCAVVVPEPERLITLEIIREALTNIADELFGGYTWFHDVDAVNADTFPWHSPFEKVGGMGALRTVGLWDRLALTDYVKQRYAEALDEVPRLPGETGLEARMRELTYLNLARWENFLLDRKDRISMTVGLEVRVPFCDHRLVEYVFNAPWAMKNFDGREKRMLRSCACSPKKVSASCSTCRWARMVSVALGVRVDLGG